MRQVETHLWVCVDAEGRPRKAFYTREAAEEAVESDSLANEHLVDVYPDVPLMEDDG